MSVCHLCTEKGGIPSYALYDRLKFPLCFLIHLKCTSVTTGKNIYIVGGLDCHGGSLGFYKSNFISLRRNALFSKITSIVAATR